MQPVSVIDSAVSWLARNDVDTDQILPKQHMKRIERSGYGSALFEQWRGEPGFDLPPNQILVTGRNFGCGSSREHAVWALRDYGFRVLIAPSFADIFRVNCAKNGLLTVVLDDATCGAIGETGRAVVDLPAQEVRFGDGRITRFEIDPGIKHSLLGGLDDIDVTLQQCEAIAAYEARQTRPVPTTTAI
jgi:3-isopropylmalate/(R)-2-methylmalate dehydratase small subunit